MKEEIQKTMKELPIRLVSERYKYNESGASRFVANSFFQKMTYMSDKELSDYLLNPIFENSRGENRPSLFYHHPSGSTIGIYENHDEERDYIEIYGKNTIRARKAIEKLAGEEGIKLEEIVE